MDDALESAPTPAPSPQSLAVWAWFNEHIANSPVSRVTDAVNHLMAKLPVLIAELEKKD